MPSERLSSFSGMSSLCRNRATLCSRVFRSPIEIEFEFGSGTGFTQLHSTASVPTNKKDTLISFPLLDKQQHMGLDWDQRLSGVE